MAISRLHRQAQVTRRAAISLQPAAARLAIRPIRVAAANVEELPVSKDKITPPRPTLPGRPITGGYIPAGVGKPQGGYQPLKGSGAPSKPPNQGGGGKK